MAGGEPRLGTTATYMRHNDHGTTRLSTEIDRLHDLLDNEYQVFSAGSVRKWSKFGLVGVSVIVTPVIARPVIGVRVSRRGIRMVCVSRRWGCDTKAKWPNLNTNLRLGWG